MKKSEILRLGRHYHRTGEIRDELVMYFDQHGRWFGDRQSWQDNTHLDMLDRMHGAVLPVTRRTAPSRAGLRLLTSYVWDESKPAWCTYVEVAGGISLSNEARFSAPNLRSVGGSVVTRTNARINMPQLRCVDGTLDVGAGDDFQACRLQCVSGNMTASDFSFPALREVGGNLVVQWALRISAPKLQSVGGTLETRFIKCLDAPELREIGRNFTVRGVVEKISVPMLVAIRGSFFADHALDISANRLRSVGGSMRTRRASGFYRGTIKVGGVWKAHPDAKLRWEINEVARQALRDPGIEL